jgi:hypothetical protein
VRHQARDPFSAVRRRHLAAAASSDRVRARRLLEATRSVKVILYGGGPWRRCSCSTIVPSGNTQKCSMTKLVPFLIVVVNPKWLYSI